MLTYFFRPLWVQGWRPKTLAEVLNRKLCRMWMGTPADVKAMDILKNATRRE